MRMMGTSITQKQRLLYSWPDFLISAGYYFSTIHLSDSY